MLTQVILALVPILALSPSVAAHGYVSKVVIDGKTYTGPLPADAAGATNSASPIRQIADIGPVKGATNPDINCGLSAQLASMVAPANPGSSMEFYWGNPSGGNWPHQTGPLMTYMAACDTTTCDKFNGSTAKWFKIDQIGKESDGSTWYQQKVSTGSPVSLTLPTDVAPGQYLVRHEIISLQNAVSAGGCEFYPSCTQISVGGSQTGTPNQTVSFPGAYSDTDPGILDPNVYDPSSPYVFPGPPVSNLASPSDMSTSNGTQDNNSQSSPASPNDTTATSYIPTDTSTTSGYDAQPTDSSVQPTPSSYIPTDTSTTSGYDAQPTPSSYIPTDTSITSGYDAQPTDSSVQPTPSSYIPSDTSTTSGYDAQPTQSGSRPMHSGGRSTHSGGQPTQSGARSMQSGGQPTQSSVRPRKSSVQPMQPSVQSTQPSIQPTQPSVQPTDSGAQPTETTSDTCSPQRRGASFARRSSQAQHKRRASAMRPLRNPARHS